ncbi:TPA: hypothetical protein ACN30P_004879 [Vibrio parahaemolyticus]
MIEFLETAQALYEASSPYIISMFFFMLVTFLICYYALNNFDNKLVRLYSKKLHSGYGNVLFVMVSILWASSVSVFGTDIKAQVFYTKVPVSWETFSFFITVCLSVIIGIYHYIGQQIQDREKQSRPPVKAIQLASKDIIDLNKMLQTSILDWQSIIGSFNNIPKNKNLDFDKDIKKLEIFGSSIINIKKLCLESLLNVASHWDDREDEKVVYRSNLFNLLQSDKVFREIERSINAGPNPQEPGSNFNIDSINESPFFLFNDNWRSRLEKSDSILVSEQDLSVSYPKEASFKKGLPICMPFSKKDKCSGSPNQPNLHGAPLSVKLKRPVYISDLKKQVEDTIFDLKKSISHKDYINEKFVNDLNEYYENDSTKSILSIPIYKYYIGSPFSLEHNIDKPEHSIDKPERDNEKIVCIVNVYTNKSNMFNNDDMADSYSEVVKPIIYILSLLISMRVNLVVLQDFYSKLNYTKHNTIDKKEAK